MAGKEARLQAECVIWYRNEWYQNLKNLWATFNEGLNSNGKISMGMVPGVPDLFLYEPKKRGLVGIEMKYIGEKHEVLHVVRQANFILDVCDAGGFCDSKNQFMQIIQGQFEWYDPRKVLVYLATLKTKSFVWDSSKFI